MLKLALETITILPSSSLCLLSTQTCSPFVFVFFLRSAGGENRVGDSIILKEEQILDLEKGQGRLVSLVYFSMFFSPSAPITSVFVVGND